MRRSFGLSYSRSGLIALLHRLGFDYRKPERMPRGLDDAKQQAFINEYENLLNTMGADEAVVFVDAVHPTHQVRPVGCWARKGVTIAVEPTTGRQRLNIHGAINLETGRTPILEVETVDAESLIKLLGQVESAHPRDRLIHVFVDNAKYHKARIVKEWLAAAGRKCVVRFFPKYGPHLDPIELCMKTSPTIGTTRPSRSSAQRSSRSCGIPCPDTGAVSATKSPTISA